MTVHVPQEGDHPSGRALAGIGVAWAIVVVASVLVALWILHEREASLGYSPPRGPPAIAPREIGLVDQTQIRDVRSPDLPRLAEEERLHGWGWVDPERGVVHIPIEVSMRLLLGEEQP